MKKALFKDSVKEIKNTYKRFISILLMAFLGVGFFAGIRATSPDMLDTIDQYYNNQDVYDIQVISTLGLTENDIDELSKIENVEKIQGNYERDGKIKIDNKEIIIKCITLDELNRPILLEGNLPHNENECVVENTFLTANNKKIGDVIQVEIEDSTNDDGEKIQYLKKNELKIVGTVQSPLYISRDRGNSKLGTGKVNYYMYIKREIINAVDIYSNIYIKVKDAQKYITSTEKYENYINEVKDNIEKIKEQRENERHNQLVNKAQQKVDDAQKQLNTEKEDAQNKLEEAQKKLDDAKSKIQTAENTIRTNEKKANTEFEKAEKEIQNAQEQIEQNETILLTQEENVNNQIKQLENQKMSLEKLLEQISNEQERENITQQIKQIEEGITTAKKEIEENKKTIQNAKSELAKSQTELINKKKQTSAEIEKSKKQLEQSKQELKEGEEELKKNKEEFNKKISDAEKELSNAKEKIKQIENPNWYILDRNANEGYVGFIQDTNSIESIGRVFPIVFFIIATLISLTSMTRMVEEQRMQIGTLKALGYNKLQITSKYIIYASLACIIGGILGLCVGFVLLPKVIWMIYELMYQITDISISFNFKYALIGLGLIYICITGSTIYVANKELVNTPAKLMRPKPPKMGNRVLLEKLPFIWKHLNFSNKVTVRNIFRYKKRFYMTIIGILGCTALILTGFGIKDSVKGILPNQFQKIFEYNYQVSMKDSLSSEDKNSFVSNLRQNKNVEKLAEVYMTTFLAENQEESENVQIIIPNKVEEIDGIINIIDLKNKERIKLSDNQVCITDKVAQLLKIKEGDNIRLKDSDNNEYEIKVTNITENYVSHYIFMTKETYENVFEKTYNSNVVLTKNLDLSNEAKEKFSSEMLNKKEVASITDMDTIINNLNDTMNLLNYVVVVLIVSAGLLAFVVLYNLANVNISERIRELATIKVLGFYDKEVYQYVTRETIILTIIGIALGLIGGYFLCSYIMGTCEINILRFSKEIKTISYVYSALITIIFTAIVNIVTYFALKKIDMIENLKSIE